MIESIQKVLLALIVLCLTGLIIIYLFLSETEYYEVHKSWTTKQCIKVVTYNSENPNGIESECPETLPEKYHNVWVK